MTVQWSLWRQVKLAGIHVVLAAGCYLVGWMLSTTASAMPFARSGAFATGVAILFTLWDYRAALTASEADAVDRIGKALRGLDLKYVDVEPNIARIASQAKTNTGRAEKVVTRVQVILLVLATVVWGFGDLAAPIARAAPPQVAHKC